VLVHAQNHILQLTSFNFLIVKGVLRLALYLPFFPTITHIKKRTTIETKMQTQLLKPSLYLDYLPFRRTTETTPQKELISYCNRKIGLMRGNLIIFFFGNICWELASRKIPFFDTATALQLHLIGLEPDQLQFPEDCPPNFIKFIRQCWANNTSNQLNGMLEVLAMLELAYHTSYPPTEQLSNSRALTLHTTLTVLELSRMLYSCYFMVYKKL
jgi:hypothetical protein